MQLVFHLANVSNRVLQIYVMQGQDTSKFSFQVWRINNTEAVVLAVCVCGFVDGLTCQEGSSILSIRPAML